MWVELQDARILGVPQVWFPRLLEARPEQRMDYELSAFGIHWDALNEDISVAGLLAGQRRPDNAAPPGCLISGRSAGRTDVFPSAPFRTFFTDTLNIERKKEAFRGRSLPSRTAHDNFEKRVFVSSARFWHSFLKRELSANLFGSPEPSTCPLIFPSSSRA